MQFVLKLNKVKKLFSKYISPSQKVYLFHELQLILAFTTALASVSLFVGSIIFTINTDLSQVLGYFAFILVLISALVLILVYRHEMRSQASVKLIEPYEQLKMETRNFILANIIWSTFLIFLIARNVIFSSTVLAYSSPSLAMMKLWPYPFSLVGGYIGNNQGFIIQSLFMNWESYLPISIITFDKIQILTALYFYYFLAAAVSRVVYKAINKTAIKEYVFSMLFATLFLANFLFRSEGFSSFIIGPIMLVYAIAKIYSAVKYDDYKTIDAFKIGWAISFGIFGDPRVLVYFAVIIFGFLLFALVAKNAKTLSKFLIKPFFLIIPFFLIMYVMVSFTSNFVANAGRSGDVQTLAFFSSGTEPMFIWNFLSNWWSNFVVAPPSLINVNSGATYYFKTIYAGNAVAVIPSGATAINILWSVSLSIVSIFAIFSVYLHVKDDSNRKLSYLFIPFILMFVLSLGTNIEFYPIVQFIALLSALPVVGPLWAVTVSTPHFISFYLAPFTIFLASYSVLQLSDLYTTIEKVKVYAGAKHLKNVSQHYFVFEIHYYNNKKVRKLGKYSVVIFVLAMFLLANWQFLDPTYSLGQELPGQLPGNAVSNLTILTPINEPHGFLSTYSSLYSDKNLNYSVYSSIGTGIPNIGAVGVSPNPQFGQILQTIVLDNMSYLVPQLMSVYGVRYVFLDKAVYKPDMALYNILLNSSLRVVVSNQNFTVFELNPSSDIYTTNATVHLNENNPIDDLTLLSLLHSAGINTAIFPVSGATLNFNSGHVINSPSGGIFQFAYNVTPPIYPTLTFNGMNTSGSTNADQFNIGDGLNVTTFNNGNGITYSVHNGSLSIYRYNASAKYNASPSNYADPIFLVGYGIYPFTPIDIPSGAYVIVNYSFSYSATSSGQLSLFAGSESYTLQSPIDNKHITGTFTIQGGTKSFGIGWGAGKFNGILNLSNVHLSYTFVKNGMIAAKSLHETVHGIGNLTYYVLYNCANATGTASIRSETLASSPDGILNISISNISYIGYIAIFRNPDNLNYNSDSKLSDIFSYGGSEIKVNGDTNRKYLVVSYNPSYQWSTSSNLKLIGINDLGQQIFSITSPGTMVLTISGALPHFYMDWSAAFLVDIAIPVLLFVVVGKKYRISRKGRGVNNEKQ